MARPSFSNTLYKITRALAERSTCSARAAVGAVLYDNDHRILAEGYNGPPRGIPHCDDVGCVKDAAGHCMVAIHAEENALLQCAAVGIPTKGLRLFVTHSPCFRCAMRLIQAGIVEVTFVDKYGPQKDYFAVQDTFNLLNIPYNQYRFMEDYGKL